MAWDLSNMNISDDSTSESASSSAIYHDGTHPRPLPNQHNPNIVTAQQNANTLKGQRNHIYESGTSLDGRSASTARLTNNIYDCAKPQMPNSGDHPMRRRDQMMQIYDTAPNNNSVNTKTALLLTGGNGYKRGTLNDTPYSSLHAHCIVWEYKL